jgi:uncharacterized protein YoaH (UPF0181 family)
VSPDGYEIISIYGSSETIAGVASFAVDKKYDNTPIGKAVEGYAVYLLDENGSEVKDGEEGEICIAGIVARGYINLPDETKEAFRENPFSQNEDDKILFCSGDIGKRLPDGNLLYVNRKDWMLKINGQRVEPGEIEAIINTIPGIDTAVVKGFENEYGQSYMCAYYKETKPVSPEEIRAELLKKIPPYMVPLFIEKIEQFPINSNGKLDRKSLASPDISQYRNQYQKPENKVQELICSGFSSVLKQDSIGIDDDFFALGGDSIKGIMLQKACEKIDLTAEDIFTGRTPRIMALLCANKQKENREEKQEDPFKGLRKDLITR